MKNTIFILFIFSLLVAIPLEKKREMIDHLIEKNKKLIEEGRYKEASDVSAYILEMNDEIRKILESRKQLARFDYHRRVCLQVKANVRFPKKFSKLMEHYSNAISLITSEDHPEARNEIKLGLDIAFELLEAVKKVVPKSVEIKKENSFYTVRLRLDRRDCLWRIAEYSYIYNDPFKWKLIYKANKANIKDPDLIYPGQVLTIPPEPEDFTDN